jgi:hypothetical protein
MNSWIDTRKKKQGHRTWTKVSYHHDKHRNRQEETGKEMLEEERAHQQTKRSKTLNFDLAQHLHEYEDMNNIVEWVPGFPGVLGLLSAWCCGTLTTLGKYFRGSALKV